jgi:endo-1,4-beta-xylanase
MKRVAWFLLAVSFLCGTVPVNGDDKPIKDHLRDLAGDFLIGYASNDNFWTLPDVATYEATASDEFNILTPENQMKFQDTEPQQGVFDFAAGDRHVQFAQAHGMKVHGHCLVWHHELPNWVTGRSWTAAQLTAVMTKHIDAEVGHYKGKVALWDVVNEALNDDGSLRQTIWETTIGPQYIPLAYRQAHADDPNAVLVYNDFSVETVNAKSTAELALISKLRQQGVPINAVGFQMHLDRGIDVSSLAANMQRFARLGLQIYVTEMDVRYPTPISQADMEAQAKVYSDVLQTCLNQPACKGLQTWGFTDKYSWIPARHPGEGAALEFDANYAPKPAYFSMQQALRQRSHYAR